MTKKTKPAMNLYHARDLAGELQIATLRAKAAMLETKVALQRTVCEYLAQQLAIIENPKSRPDDVAEARAAAQRTQQWRWVFN